MQLATRKPATNEGKLACLYAHRIPRIHAKTEMTVVIPRFCGGGG